MQEKVNKALAELIVAVEEALPKMHGSVYPDETLRLANALAAVNALLFPEKQI